MEHALGLRHTTAMSFLDYLFDVSNYPARRNCGLWSKGEVLVHNIADLVILFCYTVIPAFLVWFAWKKKNKHRSGTIFYLFAGFIFSCGLTHLMEVVMFYWPAYRLAGANKMVCATISFGTLGFIIYHLPEILQMRTLKELEHEVDEATHSYQLNAANKDEFIAMLGHELRNPLAAINNAATLLSFDNIDSADQAIAVDIIQKQVSFLSHLVDDVIHVSRIIKGKMQLNKEMIPFSEIVNLSTEIADPVIEAKHQKLELHIKNPSLEIFVDKHRVVQMVTNLLTNAAKYTPNGGNIRLSAEKTNSHVTITVEDNGIGIEPEHIGQIFDLCVRTKRASIKEQGFGMGLTVVKTIAERHGGTVIARSGGVDKGSTFEITLPIDGEPQ